MPESVPPDHPRWKGKQKIKESTSVVIPPPPEEQPVARLPGEVRLEPPQHRESIQVEGSEPAQDIESGGAIDEGGPHFYTPAPEVRKEMRKETKEEKKERLKLEKEAKKKRKAKLKKKLSKKKTEGDESEDSSEGDDSVDLTQKISYLTYIELLPDAGPFTKESINPLEYPFPEELEDQDVDMPFTYHQSIPKEFSLFFQRQNKGYDIEAGGSDLIELEGGEPINIPNLEPGERDVFRRKKSKKATRQEEAEASAKVAPVLPEEDPVIPEEEPNPEDDPNYVPFGAGGKPPTPPPEPEPEPEPVEAEVKVESHAPVALNAGTIYRGFPLPGPPAFGVKEPMCAINTNLDCAERVGWAGRRRAKKKKVYHETVSIGVDDASKTLLDVDEEEARVAFDNFLHSRAISNSEMGHKVKLVSLNHDIVFEAVLETFVELRQFRDVFVPYEMGEDVDDSSNGPPPSMWQVELKEDPELFKNGRHGIKVPRTDFVKTCFECKGLGSAVCRKCDEEKKVECPLCEGRGKLFENSGRCPTCKGAGELLCPTCNGDDKITCLPCQGHGRLRHYVELLIEYKNVISRGFNPIAGTTVALPELVAPDEVVPQSKKRVKDADTYEAEHAPNKFKKAVARCGNGTLCWLEENYVIPLSDKRVNHKCCALVNGMVRDSGDVVSAFETEFKVRHIRQRLSVRAVPLVKFDYKWKGRNRTFWVCGTNKMVRAPAYPVQSYTRVIMWACIACSICACIACVVILLVLTLIIGSIVSAILAVA